MKAIAQLRNIVVGTFLVWMAFRVVQDMAWCLGW